VQVISLIWGIFAILGMLVAFIPCLGWLNWLNIPFAGIGLIVSVVAFASEPGVDKSGSIGGIICCTIAIIFGIFRLIIGAGII